MDGRGSELNEDRLSGCAGTEPKIGDVNEIGLRALDARLPLRLKGVVRDCTNDNFRVEFLADTRVADFHGGARRPCASGLRGRTKVILAAVLGGFLALLLLAGAIWRPGGLYLDELLYVPVARALLHGSLPELPSQIPAGWHHPPLGSYLISFGIILAGDNPLGWRLAGIVFGALTLVAIFLWTYLLLRDYRLALTAMVLTAFNNLWFVMSRVAMLDVFFFAFAIWGVVGITAAFRLEARVGFRRVCVLFSGVMFGLSAACKWTAVDTISVMFAIAFVLFLGAKVPAAAGNKEFAAAACNIRSVGWLTLVVGFIVLPILSYLAPILAELREAHCTISLREILILHGAMFRQSKSFPGSLLMRAPWYSWPLRTNPLRGLSYLLGNFVVMWSGLVALVICLRRLWNGFRLPEVMVVLLYAANLLQWAITPIKTPIYYYYYSAAMFLGPVIVIALNQSSLNRTRNVRISFFLIVSAAVFFMYCYPRMAALESPWDCMFGCWN